MSMSLDLGYTRKIIQESLKYGLSQEQTAYTLGTAYWETARTMEPVREAFHLSENWRKNNLRYYPWYGRGFVQLTWEDNYRRASRELGVDLTTDADAVMDPEISAKILIVGMSEGWFTGRKLTDYINESKTDFVGARRIVNGTDKASMISSLAQDYLSALRKEGIGGKDNGDSVNLPVLRLGSRGVFVLDVQKQLADLNYFPGDLDTIYGNRTRDAVLKFQAYMNLPTDGVFDEDDWSALRVGVKPPERDITLKDLRDRGSRTVKGADRNDTIATVTAVGETVRSVAEEVNSIKDSVSGYIPTPELILTAVGNNWIYLLIIFVILGAFLYHNHKIRSSRVEDGRVGGNMVR